MTWISLGMRRSEEKCVLGHCMNRYEYITISSPLIVDVVYWLLSHYRSWLASVVCYLICINVFTDKGLQWNDRHRLANVWSCSIRSPSNKWLAVGSLFLKSIDKSESIRKVGNLRGKFQLSSYERIFWVGKSLHIVLFDFPKMLEFFWKLWFCRFHKWKAEKICHLPWSLGFLS